MTLIRSLFLVVMTLLTNSAHDGTIDMAFSIKPSLLPRSELWTVKQSWIMQRKAITPETHIIESDENLINLIIHAWQGDKNAMIQYARIQFLVDDNVFLEDFYKKNAHRIVNRYGHRLKRPDVFNMDYSEFITTLAEMRYPLAARLATGRLKWTAGTTYTKFNPLTHENRNKLIRYMRYAIKGGYHEYSSLADYILFPSGFAFKNSYFSEVNSLSDRITNLSKEQLMESFSAYKMSALHGSQYAQIRISEFYLYGAGIEQNLEQAYAWSLVAQMNYRNYQQKYADQYRSESENEEIFDNFNKTIRVKLKEKGLSPEQKEKGLKIALQIKDNILEWNYYTWRSEHDPIMPEP